MWWIMAIVGAVAVLVAIIGVIVMAMGRSPGGGGDIMECPHCQRSISEPPRRRTGADIELYDFPCPRCGKTIYAIVRRY